jgi:hypothetical protein
MQLIGNKLFPDEGKIIKNVKTGKLFKFGCVYIHHDETASDYVEVDEGEGK